MRAGAAGAFVAALLFTSGCNGPAGPTAQPPSISCPEAQTAQSLNNTDAVVNFPPPAVSGGAAPVIPTCTPPAGSSFPIGIDTVTCSATDAQRRTVSCTFQVTVTRPPRLQFTKFLAYGDSLTEGKLVPPVASCTTLATVRGPGVVLQTQVLPLCEFPSSYTSTLRDLLHARYTAQTFDVRNDGQGGETTTEALAPTAEFPGGRFPMSLSTNRPEVLLLMEGSNDLELGAVPDTPAHNLRNMVRLARGQGVRVFVATLPPLGTANVGYPNLSQTNDFIRGMASEEGATLVDVFAALNGGPYLGSDGLHLTEDGYKRVANVFFDSIRANLEVSGPGATGVGFPPTLRTYRRTR